MSQTDRNMATEPANTVSKADGTLYQVVEPNKREDSHKTYTDTVDPGRLYNLACVLKCPFAGNPLLIHTTVISPVHECVRNIKCKPSNMIFTAWIILFI